MLRYNLKQSWRSLTTNKFLTFLILTSFSVGLAACMVLALYIHREYTVDQCYPNYERIYRLIDTTKNNASMDYEIAEKLKNSFPEVELAAPVIYKRSKGDFVQSIPDKQSVFVDHVINTSNDFFTVFSVKTLAGNAQSPFADETSVVVTRSLAEKLFGKIDIVGKQVNWGVISAVVEDLPENSSLRAELFLNCMGEKSIKLAQLCIGTDTGGTSCYNPMSIYIKFTEGADPTTSLINFNTNFPPNKSSTKRVTLQALKDISLSTNIQGSDNKPGNAMTPIYLAIAITILFLSIFNYVNFTLSKQLSIFRQLGIRLVNGAGAVQLRLLCITEVVITITLAFFIALAITGLGLPMAASILDAPLSMSVFFSPILIVILMGILFVSLIVSVLAPLYIISTFDIQSLFGKNGFRFGKQRVKLSLTLFQMIASIVLLVSLLTIYLQLNHIRKFDLGFDKEHLVTLYAKENSPNWSVLKQQIDQCSFVEISSASQGVPGSSFMSSTIGGKDDSGEDLKTWFTCLFIDEFFMQTLGITLQAGREFTEADKGKACYINQAGFQQTGWKSIEGKRYLNLIDEGVEIIGVTTDFNIKSLHNTIEPVCLAYLEAENLGRHNLSIRLRPGNVVDQLKELERIWKKTIPEAPFQYTFYDEAFDAFYRKEQQQAKAISIFSIIALVITCMGLLGQVFQTCLARVKEIGIRKINGAHASEIILLLNRDLLTWMAVAFVVAVPLSYFIMNKWLENFAYKIALSWWIFVLAGLATLSLATITVSWLTWHAANNNPAEAIKSE